MESPTKSSNSSTKRGRRRLRWSNSWISLQRKRRRWRGRRRKRKLDRVQADEEPEDKEAPNSNLSGPELAFPGISRKSAKWNFKKEASPMATSHWSRWREKTMVKAVDFDLRLEEIAEFDRRLERNDNGGDSSC